MDGKKSLVCVCSNAGLISKSALSALCSNLKSRNEDVLICPDLCFMAVNSPEKLRNFCKGNVQVFACHKRAARSILDYAGASANFEFFDLKSDCNSVLKKFEIKEGDDFLLPECTDKSWAPWYPTIDYSRCVACGKCVDFCVFKVYEKSEKKVSVKNPKSCKDGCPACARICPKQAIIFPKCNDEAISGAENLSIDTNDGDFYAALKMRRLAAKSIIRKKDK